jgi:hypothetical protein
MYAKLGWANVCSQRRTRFMAKSTRGATARSSVQVAPFFLIDRVFKRGKQRRFVGDHPIDHFVLERFVGDVKETLSRTARSTQSTFRPLGRGQRARVGRGVGHHFFFHRGRVGVP